MQKPVRRLPLVLAILGLGVLAGVAVALWGDGVASPGQGNGDDRSGAEVDPAGGGSSSGPVAPGSGPGASRPGSAVKDPDAPVSSDDPPTRPAPVVVTDPPDAFAGINSFEDCAAAGYPIMESFPEQCRTPDGRLFVRVIEN